MSKLTNSRTAGPDDDDPIFAATSALFNDSSARGDMQTFVFSATLSKDLQQNLKKRYRAESKPSKKGGKKATALGKDCPSDPIAELTFQRTWSTGWTSETRTPS